MRGYQGTSLPDSAIVWPSSSRVEQRSRLLVEPDRYLSKSGGRLTSLEPVDNLEEYLLGVRILSEFAYAGHGAHTSYFLVLEGGAAALAKPADEIADGTTMVRRERAAWVVAKLLKWSDLMAATVIRTLRSYKTGLDTDASLQVIWPDKLARRAAGQLLG